MSDIKDKEIRMNEFESSGHIQLICGKNKKIGIKLLRN